ncbi:hypothetical protein KCP69_11730 [Salmonella enterica subsp. enterica]|nr:hypothetical protein KCP69_11730 [Salmonella enterica subsp. enterica]
MSLAFPSCAWRSATARDYRWPAVVLPDEYHPVSVKRRAAAVAAERIAPWASSSGGAAGLAGAGAAVSSRRLRGGICSPEQKLMLLLVPLPAGGAGEGAGPLGGDRPSCR